MWDTFNWKDLLDPKVFIIAAVLVSAFLWFRVNGLAQDVKGYEERTERRIVESEGRIERRLGDIQKSIMDLSKTVGTGFDRVDNELRETNRSIGRLEGQVGVPTSRREAAGATAGAATGHMPGQTD